MKTFKIEISGKTESDIDSTMAEVSYLIENGMLSGFHKGMDASFSFDSEGEYEDEEEEATQ